MRLLLPFALLAALPLHAADTPAPIGTRVGAFSLPDPVTGKNWDSADARDAKALVVVFLGTECPVSNGQLPALAALHKEFATKGVTFVGVNSNAHDSPEEVAKHLKAHAVPFPVLKDLKGEVARRFKAERLPTAFVLDASGVARYRGRIDDAVERGLKRPAATARDLRDALDAVLAGREVAKSATEPGGCPINFGDRAAKRDPAKAAVTYAKQVSRIIQANCQGCHRPGEAGPFALMSYRDAEAWSDAIREVVAERIMPPWHADPKHGTFRNTRRLSDADRDTVLGWIDAGCPEGDFADLPAPAKYVEGWNIGTPNMVVTMNEEVQIPAQAPRGGIPYKYVWAGEPFDRERWVTSAEVRPGARAVVHHVIVHVVKPGQRLENLQNGGDLLDAVGLGAKGQPEHLLAFVPGDQAFVLPQGMAKRLPKGSRLAFELHYTPNGKAAVDRSAVGLTFADAPPKHVLRSTMIIKSEFAIPPGAASHPVEAEHPIPIEVVVRALAPHMHLRGKAFEYRLVVPGKADEVLLSVPKYDFNWQHSYVLAEPKTLPKGSKLVCRALFDNSKGNPNNPDPSKRVRWGDQTWDEMMLGFVEWYVPAAKPK